jgi:flavin reductase (DIM6/NTAB) family NADH-FMN oxidoreductase RutF/nicotinamidase-related amidase
VSTRRPPAAVDDELRRRGFGGFGGAGEHPCLLIVDATAAFTSPESPLCCDDDRAVAAISELLAAAREASVPVVYTTVVVGPEQRKEAEHFLRKMPGLLSIAENPAWSRIDQRLEPRPGEPVLEKIYPSAFCGTPLATLLAEARVDTVIVTGMSTSGCVRASVVDVLQHGYRPVVAREAVADRDDYAHAAALRDLELKYADVMPVREVIDYFRACGSRAGEPPPAGGGSTDASGLDQARFAELMAVLASGVAVITTRAADGPPKGLTTTAVCSASADPPLLLTCIDRNSRTLPALRETGAFVVNFMRTGQEEVCRRFASKRDDKFDHVAWHETDSGLPVLRDHVVAWTECRTVAEYEAGDHVILLGHIESGEVPEGEWGPLVYYRRGWGMWHPQPAGAR